MVRYWPALAPVPPVILTRQPVYAVVGPDAPASRVIEVFPPAWAVPARSDGESAAESETAADTEPTLPETLPATFPATAATVSPLVWTSAETFTRLSVPSTRSASFLPMLPTVVRAEVSASQIACTPAAESE